MQSPTPRFHAFAAGCLLGCLVLASGARVASAQEAAPAEAPEPAAEGPDEAGEQDREAEVEVIHVRGRGSGGIETEIPASVTTFDAATIVALGAEDISDLSRVTPNVSIVQPGATQATFFIRGIGLSDFSSNAAGAVSIFQDDVAINAPAIQTGQLFDIEDVDIVRGPQGTGHFRNASAGAIRVRSRRPTGIYSAQLRASLGRYQAESGLGANHALIQDYEGALELPISEGLLSARFAFRLRDADPYKRNDCGGIHPRPTRQDAIDAGVDGRDDAAVDAFVNVCGERGNTYVGGGLLDRSTLPAGLPSRVGDAHNWAARGIFRLTPPGSEWDVQLNAHGSRLDQQSTVGQVIGTSTLQFATNRETVGNFGGPTRSVADPLYQEPDIFEEYRGVDGNGGLCQSGGSPRGCTNRTAQLQLAENLSRKRPLDIRPYRGDFDLVGQTTRDAYGAVVSAEGTLGDSDLSAIASYDGYQRAAEEDLDFTADELIYQLSEDEAWQSYEEIRLAGELSDEPFGWELGGYYLYEDLKAEVSNRILDRGFSIFRDFDQQIHSAAVWGGFAWDFLDALTLEGGVRWNFEQKDFDYFRLFNTDPASISQRETWSEPTGELILTWHLDENVDAYTRYTHGFKAGHYNSIATFRLDTLLAKPETIDAWEAGLRGRLWNGRLQAAGAFFYYRYTDFQVFLFSDVAQQPPTLEIVNAAEAELYGVELEGNLSPLRGWAPRILEGLLLSGNVSWLQGQYIDFQDEQTFPVGGGFTTVTFDFSGNALANAPRYKFSGAAEWTFDLGRFGSLIPRYDVSWTDDQFFDPREGQGSVQLGGQPSLPELTVAQPALWLHGVRLGYRTPSGNVEVAGWVRNLTDEVYKNFVFDASRFAGAVLHFTGEPRTVGIDVIVTF